MGTAIKMIEHNEKTKTVIKNGGIGFVKGLTYTLTVAIIQLTGFHDQKKRREGAFCIS